MKKIIFMIGVVLILFASCEKDQGPFVIVDTTKKISFEKDIQSIFNARCISCHNQNHYLNLESCCSYDILMNDNYIDTINPSQSYLYMQVKLPNPQMPYNSTPLSEQEVSDILRWIEDGAKNN